MKKEELIELLSVVEAGADVDNILKNTDLYKSVNKLTLDQLKEKVATEKEFTNWLNSEKDKHHEKALNTWKNNNLQNLIDAEILKRNPQKSAEQLEMERLKAEIESIKAEKMRAELNSKFKDTFNSKGIPTQLSSFLLNSDDEEVINANITLFENAMKSYIDAEVNKRLIGSPKPTSGIKSDSNILTKEEFSKMSYSEKVKLYQENKELFTELSK